jgi:hypothetical protein
VINRYEDKLPVPLWRLQYGNVDRLDQIAAEIAGDKTLARAAAKLEAASAAVIDELLSSAPRI